MKKQKSLFWIATYSLYADLLWKVTYKKWSPLKCSRADRAWMKAHEMQVQWAAGLVSKSGWNGMHCELEGKPWIIEVKPT